MAQLKSGDFDLVLLDRSIPLTNREGLTSLLRASGSLIPVVCIMDPPSNADGIASLKMMEAVRETAAMRQKSKPKRRSPRSVLRLPDLDHSKSSVLQSLGSAASQRTYRSAIDEPGDLPDASTLGQGRWERRWPN
jgi:hypothetical protein